MIFNEEWNDVVPIPQDDGPNPLAPINYDPNCKNEKFLLKI